MGLLMIPLTCISIIMWLYSELSKGAEMVTHRNKTGEVKNEALCQKLHRYPVKQLESENCIINELISLLLF